MCGACLKKIFKIKALADNRKFIHSRILYFLSGLWMLLAPLGCILFVCESNEKHFSVLRKRENSGRTATTGIFIQIHTFASIQDPIYHLKGFSYKLRASLYTLHTNPKYSNLLTD